MVGRARQPKVLFYVELPYDVYDNDLNAFLREGDVVAMRGYNTQRQGLVVSVNEDSGRVLLSFGDGSQWEFPMMSTSIDADMQLMRSTGSTLTVETIREFEHDFNSANLEAHLGRKLTGRENQELLNNAYTQIHTQDYNQLFDRSAKFRRVVNRFDSFNTNAIISRMQEGKSVAALKIFNNTLHFVNSFHVNAMLCMIDLGYVKQGKELFWRSIKFAKYTINRERIFRGRGLEKEAEELFMRQN